MQTIILSLFSLFILASADDTLQLNDANFESQLAQHDAALVMFYAPWCGHCKRLKPEYEQAATLLKENDPPVALVKVDCTEDGKDTCSKFGVSGYPTLKIFKDGEMSSDYNGPREANGIVKFMKGQVGPASKLLSSLDEAEKFIKKDDEVSIVYFGEGSSLKDAFMKIADKLRENFRFAHCLTPEVSKLLGYEKNTVALFRQPRMANKFEDSTLTTTDDDKSKLEKFIKDNVHGLVGLRTQDTESDFGPPVVVAYYDVDYVKNPKGTNYWRNRILKVAQDFKDDFTFGISSKNDFQHEMEEFGLGFTSGDKPVVCARNAKGEKFVMKDEFSMDTLKTFIEKVKNGELEKYLKSEEVPTQDSPVKVAVAKNFDELVTNSGRDALVEFYAPWCGHCKKLVPVYDELAEKLKDEDVDIVKMDATANDVSSDYEVRGFPTIFWKPKDGAPRQYQGGREVDDFIKYIAENASDELKGYTRKGKQKEEKAEEKEEL